MHPGHYLFCFRMQRYSDIYYQTIYFPAETSGLKNEIFLAMISALKYGVLAADLF
ncbi:hypothetical protein HMPREF9444_00697 [Succinatimonas hippei YIT 12066]|uniref:Uncharacterized protein n=1 Tax=Succinatimonas hippei (strain DSM 22608 / JCM 16073 / KCTC 15190 / YIT 12066) TaxID=762983 RepID=E8LJ24_SUCHY|nr:hypothetical protein HMPREF9444_00697 [Succinatimonas hippei YIT 12066]